MKLKITITGQKVHDVGYRPYLAELAICAWPSEVLRSTMTMKMDNRQF
jgi:hypothetical protein